MWTKVGFLSKGPWSCAWESKRNLLRNLHERCSTSSCRMVRSGLVASTEWSPVGLESTSNAQRPFHMVSQGSRAQAPLNRWCDWDTFPFHGIMKPFTSSLMRLLFPKFRNKLTTMNFYSMPVSMSKAKFRSSVVPQAPEALSLPLYSVQWFSAPCTAESPRMIPHRLWLDSLAKHWSFIKAWQVILICSQDWELPQ